MSKHASYVHEDCGVKLTVEKRLGRSINSKSNKLINCGGDYLEHIKYSTQFADLFLRKR